MTLSFLADRVENPANLARIDDAAMLLGALRSSSIVGRLIAVENTAGARSVYGRRPLSGDATLVVGNERRGLSRETLRRADETVVIPTLSRTVTTLNVAAALAVAAWYVLHGSGAQRHVTTPEIRMPALLIIGDDHVEVGSSLRSAAAFGFRDVLLDDRGAGWFDGSSSIRREAFAAARRHKNPLRVHRATLEVVARFDEIVIVIPCGAAVPLKRERLAHGRRQLIIVGAGEEDIARIGTDRVRVATLGVGQIARPPLRLVASIIMAEIARQVGCRPPTPGRRAPGPPTYDSAIPLIPEADILLVEPSQLLTY